MNPVQRQLSMRGQVLVGLLVIALGVGFTVWLVGPALRWP